MRRLGALFLGMVVVATAALRPAPAITTDPAAWEIAVQGLLDRREAAVMARDETGFLDTVDPEARPGFREAQEVLFAGLATVPLERYDLILRSEDVYDLSAGVGDRRDADEVRLPAAEVRYRLAGIDAVDAVEVLWYTFVRRGEHWYVAADGDVADLGLQTSVNPWDFGPVTLVGGQDVAVVADPADVERGEALLDISDQGLGRLRRTLGWASPPKVLVMVPRTTSELEEILQTTFDLTNFVAFAAADVDRTAESGWQWTAPRVYAQEQNLLRHDRDFQVETLHHELVHVVAFDRAGPFVPNWVHEGHADWEAFGRPPPERVPGSDGVLPLDYEFVAGGGTSILRSYRESVSAIAFLADEVGPDAPARLFERLGSVRVAPGTWRYHLDEAQREVWGSGSAAFEWTWNGGRVRDSAVAASGPEWAGASPRPATILAREP